MSKQSNIPQLRFKEFDGKWEEKVLKEICTFFSGGTPTSTNRSFYNGNIPFIGSGNIYDEYVSNFITEEALNNCSAKLVRTGDLLYALYGANSGEVAISKMDGAINQAILCIRTKAENIEFIYYVLLLNKDKIVAKYLQGGQGNLSADIIKKLKYSIPTLPEQEKIASFLSAVDEKIQQLTRKAALLEQYKKGVMQQLFSGKLRFKDENGEEYVDWEEKKLGDVAEIKRGAASQHLKYVGDETKGIRLLRINDFLNDDAVYVENTEDMKRFTVQTNDILIAGTGATAGITFIIPEKFNNLSFSYNAPRIRVKSAFYEFIYHYLKSGLILKQQKSLFVGNAQPFLDTDTMRGFKINLPQLSEQQKIAGFLSGIDEKIGVVRGELEKMQGFKKGLLQRMFV